ITLRVFMAIADISGKRSKWRNLTMSGIAAMVPSDIVEVGEASKSISVSTLARAINSLSKLGYITDQHDNPVRVSNKTKGVLRIRVHRRPRHDCPASRNAYDQFARANNLSGDKAAQYPTANGAPAPELVPPAPELVPPAPELVPPAPELVPPHSDTPNATSRNADPSISPPNLPTTYTPPPPGGHGRDESSVPPGDRIDGGEGNASQGKGGGTGLVEHRLTAVALVGEIPKSNDIEEKKKVVDKIVEKLNSGIALDTIRAALKRDLPDRINSSLTGLYLHRLNNLKADDSGQPQPATTHPNAHAYVDDGSRYCADCDMPRPHASHRVPVGA